MRAFALVGLALTLLAGCGGGGGDDDASPPTPTPAATASGSPSPTGDPTATASPSPEILLAAGRTFDEEADVSLPLVLRNVGAGWATVAIDAPAQAIVNGIVFSTPEVAWAFGFFGDPHTPVLFVSSDAGVTWVDVAFRLPADTRGIADLAFADASTGVMVTRAVVAGSAAVVTRDGGLTWQPVAPLPGGGLVGSYAVGTRGTAAELVRYESDGLAILRLDDPSVPPVRLAAPGGTRIPGPNAFSTVGLRGWIAFNRFGDASRAAIITSASPGADWVEQAIDQTGYGELRAIDVRDPENGIAGGRGATPASTGLSPLALVLDAEAATWRIASIAGVAPDASVVDVLRTRGDGAWAIVARTDVQGEAAFIRSVDGGRSWNYEATAFEHGVELHDLARNTERR